MTDHLYRYVNHQDVVEFERHAIIKRTPKGWWIQDPYDPTKKRFVLEGTFKKFAAKDEAEAKVSFFARKRRQLAILKRQVEDIEAAVEALKAGRVGDYSASSYNWEDY